MIDMDMIQERFSDPLKDVLFTGVALDSREWLAAGAYQASNASDRHVHSSAPFRSVLLSFIP